MHVYKTECLPTKWLSLQNAKFSLASVLMIKISSEIESEGNLLIFFLSTLLSPIFCGSLVPNDSPSESK